MHLSAQLGDLGGTQDALTRAARLAARQFGAIARWQLLELGFSAARVRSSLRRGRLHRRYPGVYAWGRPDLSTEGELIAALLFAGRGSALGSVTALWWMGLLGRRPDRNHVDAPGGRRSAAGISIRHPGHVPCGGEVERRLHRGVPTVPLPQALLAATAHLGHDTLRLVLARAEFRKLLSLPEVERALGTGRDGTRALRAALGAHLPELARCANQLERDFVLLCERFRLPLPEPNARIGRYRPDMLWREAMLIVELDGKSAHSTAAQLGADRRRQAVLEPLGYTVLRFRSAEIRKTPDRAAARVRGHLDRAGRRESAVPATPDPR